MKKNLFILALLPLAARAQTEVGQPIEPVEVENVENMQPTEQPFTEFAQTRRKQEKM